MCSGAKYDDFVEDVYAAEKDKECRFAIFDFEFEGDVGRMISKILFFMWSVEIIYTISVKDCLIPPVRLYM